MIVLAIVVILILNLVFLALFRIFSSKKNHEKD